MSKKEVEKKNIIIEIGEQISSGGMKITIVKGEPTGEEKKK